MVATEWYRSAVFANLSYVRWTEENTFTSQTLISEAADAGRTSVALGNSLFSVQGGWQISSFHPNDESGFAANIFQNDSEIVLAIRGTEANLIEALPFVGETGLQDLIRADLIDIGIAGFALEQTISLANYVMRLQADTTDTSVAQIALHSKVLPAGMDPGIDVPFIKVSNGIGPLAVDTYFWLEDSQPATGLGILGDGSATVTGHSLGGHLAVLAIRLFPDLFTDAVTFNAPGFDPATSMALTDQFVALIGQALGITPATTFGDVAGRVTAIESESSAPGDDPSLVASLLTGIPVGEEVQVHTENNSHSMDQLMDDLSVHGLIARLNPSLALGELHRAYDGAASDPGATNEVLLQSLARSILGSTPDIDVVEAGLISHGAFGLRSEMHDLVVELTAAIDARGLTLEPLWQLSAIDIAELAMSASEYRVALVNLDPYVIHGNDAIYSQMAADAGVTNDTQSADYWLARAQMLLALADHGIADGNIGDTPYGTMTIADVSKALSFYSPLGDGDSPTLVSFTGSTVSNSGVLSGTGGDDALFGGTGTDRLQGGAGVDRLDGGNGADILIGGSSIAGQDDGAADVLAGGIGRDTYITEDGDIIMDSDRQVAGITLAGYSMSGTFVLGTDQVYRSEDGMRTLTIQDGDAYLSIVDVTEPASIVIRDFLPLGTLFEDGDFSMMLVIPGQESGPGMSLDLMGTNHDDHPWSDNSDAASLSGTSGNDGISGLDGNDYIITHTGTDAADGGPGNDYIHNQPLSFGFVDTNGDTFFGGSGDDLLAGNGGGDWLIGAEGRDLLQGASGDDLLDGGSGDDLILGGFGTDIIYGGSGDDYILADEPSRNVSAHEWVSWGNSPSAMDVLDEDPPLAPGNLGLEGNDSVWGGSGRDEIAGGGESDSLFGESGSDRLLGAYGDDFLDGGAGDDNLGGDYGDDVLFGGDQGDFLFGDEGSDVLYGGSGDDTLRGGLDGDVLAGGAGNDRYYFEEYEGWDVIREVTANPGDRNFLFMPAGQSASDYHVTRSGNDLVMTYVDEESGIVLEDWFSDPHSTVFDVHFDDAIWNNDDLAALSVGQGSRWDDVLYGSEAGETLLAGAGDDEVFGNGGDDQILGGTGHDYLGGGTGDDVLEGNNGGDFFDGGNGEDTLIAGGTGAAFAVDSMWGGAGSDTYIASSQPGATMYVLDYGTGAADHDVLVLPDGITANDFAVRRLVSGGTVTTALELTYPDTSGSQFASITIFNWFGTGVGRIESFRFSDGSTLSAADIDGRLGHGTPAPDILAGGGADVTLRGYGGDDDLFGSGTSNVLYGGAGDDQLTGSGGSNYLVGGAGDDRLDIITAQVDPDSGNPGTAILDGGRGRDVISVSSPDGHITPGAAVFIDGDDDSDVITLNGNGTSIIAGADGFDFIETTSMNVILLMNKGDDGDVLSSPSDWGRDDAVSAEGPRGSTISFGGGIVPGDVSLTRDADDLLVRTGTNEGLRLVGYFDEEGQPGQWVGQLQFVLQASPGFTAFDNAQAGAGAILLLDFIVVMDQFIAAQVPSGTPWVLPDPDGMSHAQYLHHQALGGQVAYEYALVGSGLHTMSRSGIQDLLGNTPAANTPVAISLLQTWPVEVSAILPMTAPQGSAFRFELPVEWIKDPLSGEALIPSLEGNLPEWLSYDAELGVLSGVPGTRDHGTEVINFRAVSGLGQSAIFSFNIQVEGPVTEPGVVLIGDQGRDNLSGTQGADDISGGAGADRMNGGAGDDQLHGGDGRDNVRGGEGNDAITGGAHGDRLLGNQGDDQISGGLGSDNIVGGAGDDWLSGDNGNDRISAGEGNDTIVYSNGSDDVDGGSGDDSYVVSEWSGKVNVRDAHGMDTLDLSAAAAVEDVRFTQRNDSLVVNLPGHAARLIIHDWFGDADARIESFVFSGGSQLSEQDVLELVQQRATAIPRREVAGGEFAASIRLDGMYWDSASSNMEWAGGVTGAGPHP